MLLTLICGSVSTVLKGQSGLPPSCVARSSLIDGGLSQDPFRVVSIATHGVLGPETLLRKHSLSLFHGLHHVRAAHDR